jgi:hypothetical protein
MHPCISRLSNSTKSEPWFGRPQCDKQNKQIAFFHKNRFTNAKFIDPTTNIDPNLQTNVIFHSKYVVRGIGGAPSRTIWSHVLKGVHKILFSVKL